MPVLIGTSGWQYRHWRGPFYPSDLPQRRWLEHYAEQFATVEVNNAFYRLPEAHTFEDWAARTPDGFRIAVKASRYLTHVKRLKDPAGPVERFLSRARHLGPKLGPVLLQLPPNLAADLPALEATLSRFPPDVRVVVEFRHASWFTAGTRTLLEEHGAACCLADSPRRETPVWRTANWGYLRMHEGRATPHPCYGRRALATWARRLADTWSDGEDVHVYFNNDERGCAVRDSGALGRELERSGLSPTRVPPPGAVRLGRA
ncbi:MAG TPA: DUF72 domain-containing protein [Acidimicrobiales bacterium]|nr:DUF72 domain-containing protein [Acidimicrobiales bacterium]